MEPGTPLARLVEDGGIRPQPPEKDEELWFAGVDELQRRGYRHYEVSNFCLPGKECRHNLRYWRHRALPRRGPGRCLHAPAAPVARALRQARSLPGQGQSLRLQQPRDIQAFLRAATALWGIEVERSSALDFLLETLMMGLRLAEGISAAAFRERFGSGFDELFPGLWERWVERGLRVPPRDRLALTRPGWLMLDQLLAE